MTTSRRRRVVLWPWYLLLALGVGLMLLGRLGEDWGWWNDWGTVFDVVGLVVAFWAAAYSASARALRGVTADLGAIDDRLRTVGILGERTVQTLERIERLLTERLPLRPSSAMPSAGPGHEARSLLSRWVPWWRRRRSPASPAPSASPPSVSGSSDLTPVGGGPSWPQD